MLASEAIAIEQARYIRQGLSNLVAVLVGTPGCVVGRSDKKAESTLSTLLFK